MTVAIVTGSGGLIGSEAAVQFAELGFEVVGIDNNLREFFFGPEGSVSWNIDRLQKLLGARYQHYHVDIRDRAEIMRIFRHYAKNIGIVVHAAAQPSHDWAIRDPFADFDVNAGGTLALLEASRRYSPEAVFIFVSTNKVYGDTPNLLPLTELETRFELEPSHTYWRGIREDMSIDNSLHSLFGCSKVAADILVQEYGRYFGLKSVCFRAGTLTGPQHSATQLHGFLGYVMRCTMTQTPYTVLGYKGKQVRDAIHCRDLIRGFVAFAKKPQVAAVYNIGGGRASNCSVLEAIGQCQEITGKNLMWTYTEENRVGDHIWWVSSNERFLEDYPEWFMEYDIRRILEETYEANTGRWVSKS